MATYKKTVTNYYFKKPDRLTRTEYNSLKQVLKFNPDFKFYSVRPFWKEFEFGVYFLVAFIVGLPLSMASETLSFIPGIGIAGIIFFIIFNFESMINYGAYLKARRNFFEGLRMSIRDSENFEDFQIKETKIYNQ